MYEQFPLNNSDKDTHRASIGDIKYEQMKLNRYAQGLSVCGPNPRSLSLTLCAYMDQATRVLEKDYGRMFVFFEERGLLHLRSEATLLVSTSRVC